MPVGQLQSAVPSGQDPRQHARVLARVHEATLAGERPPLAPRPVIDDSWRRVRRSGVDPDHDAAVDPLPVEELERRRRQTRLSGVLTVLRGGLVSVADEASHIMVVVDADGRVLWRDGAPAVRHRADSLGFVEGAAWDEDSVGTNAIGTALAVRAPVQVYAAEHFARTHHVWTCAASPVHDPVDGRLLGVVDVSGPAATVHASTLALVDAVARLAENQLRAAHDGELAALRAVGAPLLARVDGSALVTDRQGWVAAAAGVAPLDRVLLPEQLEAERVWLPSLGCCLVEPLPGGWLLRVLAEDAAPVTSVLLDVRGAKRWTLTVRAPSGAWQQPLSPRHAELLLVLATHPAGRSATELAEDLFGDRSRTVTVRAEMSRLRRHLAGVLDRRPYRFADWVDVRIEAPADRADLLPGSVAPAIRRLRHPVW